MKHFNKYVTSALAAMICLTLLTLNPVYAKVQGQCADCHTMHNSQNGTALETLPSANLTKGNCVGCHTGTNTGTNTTPYVYTPNAPFDSSLAGGNFHWVLENDAMGHNVKGIPGMLGDVALKDGAPGGEIMCGDSCHITLADPKVGFDTPTPLATGCEGCHLRVAHHAPKQEEGKPTTEEHGYYRFLSGHMGGDGVHGIEDSDWEYTANMHDHNEYLGDPDKYGNDNTMTRYCTGCHGDFHDQKDVAGNWIRHPSDAVIPSTGEYALYNMYDPKVPVARPDLNAISETFMLGDGDMVMCLSCHRAHGSRHPDALRWDYTQMVAGDGGYAMGTGCFKCHSDKD